jgi:hypothetical protein
LPRLCGLGQPPKDSAGDRRQTANKRRGAADKTHTHTHLDGQHCQNTADELAGGSGHIRKENRLIWSVRAISGGEQEVAGGRLRNLRCCRRLWKAAAAKFHCRHCGRRRREIISAASAAKSIPGQIPEQSPPLARLRRLNDYARSWPLDAGPHDYCLARLIAGRQRTGRGVSGRLALPKPIESQSAAAASSLALLASSHTYTQDISSALPSQLASDSNWASEPAPRKCAPAPHHRSTKLPVAINASSAGCGWPAVGHHHQPRPFSMAKSCCRRCTWRPRDRCPARGRSRGCVRQTNCDRSAHTTGLRPACSPISLRRNPRD